MGAASGRLQQLPDQRHHHQQQAGRDDQPKAAPALSGGTSDHRATASSYVRSAGAADSLGSFYFSDHGRDEIAQWSASVGLRRCRRSRSRLQSAKLIFEFLEATSQGFQLGPAELVFSANEIER